jgi:outer membrane protein W
MKIIEIKFGQMVSILALALVFISSGYSQKQQWYGAFTYSVSIPAGDTKERIDEISWRGIGLDYRYMMNPNITVGLYFGWNVLYERKQEANELETDPPGAIYGTQDNTINSFPIMASVHYYLGERKSIRPYIGLNAGGFIMLQEYAIGIFLWQNDQWQWGIAPEAGVVIPVERDFGVIVNGKYNMAFTGEDAIGNEVNNAYWSINAGIVWQP